MDDADLLQQLRADDKGARRAAVEALRARLPAIRDAMLQALRTDDDWRVRASAAAVLDHAEQDDAVEQALIGAVRDPDARVRQSALHSLACAGCKPDGCIADDSVELLVDSMLHDSSIRLRRKLSGELMWGQHGRDGVVLAAFLHLLETTTDRVLLERSATFVASCELPRESMPYREWIGAWRRRITELVEARTPQAV